MSGKIYVVPLHRQEAEITANCYGNGCGRGIFGAILDEYLGPLVPCKQETCPHLEKQTDEPIGQDGDGNDVYLRKLKAVA